MSITPPQPGESLSDYVVSLLRTVVPIAWGMVITFVVGLVPALTDFVDPATLTNWGVPITAAVTAVWYAVMRKLEPVLPAWLTVLVLGSNSTPKYLASGQVVVSTGIKLPPAPFGENVSAPIPGLGGIVQSDPKADGRAD